jgi:hypothetical protein
MPVHRLLSLSLFGLISDRRAAAANLRPSGQGLSRPSMHCAQCYAPVEKVLRCGKCKSRVFCSRECQREDWVVHGHGRWCGKSGEWLTGYEFRPSCGGIGVFTTRDYSYGDVLMVERPVIVSLYDKGPTATSLLPHALAEVMKLTPNGGTPADKFRNNHMQISDDSAGLFLTMSRVNHSCFGNSVHVYAEKEEVMVLYAACDIKANTEVTFSYTAIDVDRYARRLAIEKEWGFTCTCQMCSGDVPEIAGPLLVHPNTGVPEIIQLAELANRYRAGPEIQICFVRRLVLLGDLDAALTLGRKLCVLFGDNECRAELLQVMHQIAEV